MEKYERIVRTDEDVFKAFDEGLPEFKWFIEKHFKKELVVSIEKARKDKNRGQLLCLLFNIWCDLPDSMFNIMVNPKGWGEFINVIED